MSFSVLLWTGKDVKEITKEHEEPFGGDKCFHYVDCGGGYVNVYICQDFSDVHFKYMQSIVCQLQAVKNSRISQSNL